MKQGNNSWLVIFILLLGVGLLVAYYYKGNPQQDQFRSSPRSYPRYEPPHEPSYEPPHQPSHELPQKLPAAKSYQDALKLADKHNRPVFLYFSADWCVSCQQMKKNILNNEKVKKAISDKFIAYHVDTDVERELTRQYKISGIPAYAQITPKETIIIKGSGYKSVEDFLQWIDSKPKLFHYLENRDL